MHKRGDDNQARVCIEEKKTIADKRCICERVRERERYRGRTWLFLRFLCLFLFLSAASCAPMRGEQNRMKTSDDWCESNVYMFMFFF